MQTLSHHNHISGLRALAIVPVVLFHTNPTLFSNGYLGVDIFFVISGYLITKTLITNSKDIDVAKLFNFYLKRARRTLPALIFVVFTTIPFFIFILPPIQLVDFSQSLITTVLFLSNFLFGSENEYWGTLSELKPLLHTWSLSIEWQFYLLFPFIFFFENKKNLIIIIFILSLLSAVILNLNDYHFFLANHKIRLDHFFFSTNRIWEFLAGSLIFFYNSENKNRFKNNILSIIGLGLLVISFIFFNTEKHPGIFALIPIIGTVLIIKYSVNGTLANIIFNNYFFLHLGSISYSLYLWHQPILAYLKNIFSNNLSFQYQTFAILLSYLISLLTYNFVEKTFYEKKFLKDKIFIILCSTCISLIILSGFLISLKKDVIIKSISQKIFILNKKFPNRILEGINISTINANTFDESNRYKIHIIGDSYSDDLFWMLHHNKVLKKTFQFTGEQTGQDPFILLQEKNRRNAEAIIYTKQFYENEINPNHFIKFKEKYIEDHQKFILMGRPNEFFVGDPDPLTFALIKSKNNQELYKKNNFKQIDKYFYSILKDDVFRINSNLKKIAKDLNITYLERFDYACDNVEKICKSTNSNGLSIYIDQGHISVSGAIVLNEMLIKKNWFKPIYELSKNR